MTSQVHTRRRPLKVGLHIPHQTWGMGGQTPRWKDIALMARRAEEVGFDSLWLVDHLIMPRGAPVWRGGPPTPVDGEQRGFWECATLLSALAAATSQVELGSVVMCTAYRNPALLAKMADTIDEVSGGRLILGLGAGDAEFEHRAFGFPYESRVSRFEEAVGIVRRLLHGEEVTYDGEYYQTRAAVLQPRGPRPGGLPLMIGSLGSGPRMLRLVAQYADVWNGWLVHSDSSAVSIAPLRERIDAACEAQGRDPASLARSVALRVAVLGQPEPTGQALKGSPEAIADQLRAHAAAGISHVQVFLTPDTLAGIEAMGDVLAQLDTRRGT